MNNIESLYGLGGLHVGGPRELSNITLVDENLERLLIGPGRPPASTVLLKDSAFTRCAIRGELRIAPGVALENVLFDDVRGPDMMTVSTQAALDRVIVKGGHASVGLWVKPSDFATPSDRQECEAWAASRQSAASWMLDFSELESKEVEVVGLPLDKLRWNTERHVPLKLDRFQGSAWKALNLPSTNFWRARLRRLELFGVTEGVYSLPLEGDKRYAQTKEEMLYLVREGILDQEP
ncbi:hypothetical protein ACNRBV_04025 [Ralstonia pseudosolanacearum]|uniref:hypothetical protein n=1 Tax=Ralstonia pseudosolanacearum TaxID=1310165 RepID=UPI0018A4421D|nr:hypothetical protein [Ralstonia pseudosolanacearum]BCL93369.1 hypothetical protein MAFF211479_30700 [Ralstonia solanacearum]BCN05936.1 hypothetical protein RPSB_30730 [Ralstonia solanacearum]